LLLSSPSSRTGKARPNYRPGVQALLSEPAPGEEGPLLAVELFAHMRWASDHYHCLRSAAAMASGPSILQSGHRRSISFATHPLFLPFFLYFRVRRDGRFAMCNGPWRGSEVDGAGQEAAVVLGTIVRPPRRSDGAQRPPLLCMHVLVKLACKNS
jgi:hypothetical protein